MSIRAVGLFLFGCCFLGGLSPAAAEVFRYLDGNGTVCITDKLAGVPQECRVTLQVIGDDGQVIKDAVLPTALELQPPPKRVETHRQAAAVEATQKSEPDEKAPAAQVQEQGIFDRLSGFPWYQTVAILAGIVIALMALVKVAGSIPAASAVKLIGLLILSGFMVFAYRNGLGDRVVNTFRGGQEMTSGFVKKVNEHEKVNQEEISKAAGKELGDKEPGEKTGR